ncbi:MAG: phenylalanine--tRNA ligase subunit beta, partial [Fulvivirga sp.]|uniref:phenylalanine--tRNA ligase subunit beta n=1 Tax=Fulvivirga sp. TaxID=1931237 RepID=UPI0032ECD066
MKISYNWLKEYIELNDSPEKIGKVLTDTGLEVESIEAFETVKGGLEGIVIGEVLTCEKHPNADKLKVTTVDIGHGQVSPIVCGAPNVAAGQKVIVATVNTTLYPTESEPFKIKKAKIRGEVSEGMICAEDEIGLGTSHAGIMILDTDLPNGTPASKYFNLENDYVFEIGLTPNRADATSHIGTARDLKAALSKEIKWPSVDAFKKDNDDLQIEVEVKNSEACPRYSGVTITNVKVADSPDWLKNKLKAIGLAPINNVVDITNYVLHEVGQPLHAFDAAHVKGNKVIVDTAEEGDKFTTLDDKERTLKSNDLMICDGNRAGMCIAGVFGGINSGVTESTNAVFLESAYFSPDYVRKTAQQHQLKTDASFRFERGTDPNITVYALKRAALLIKELAGGKISSDIIDIYPSPVKDFEVSVKYKNIKRLIGQEIAKDRIHSILESLDIKTEAKTEEGFTAIVPAYRVDVQREADVIEEILRVYGFNNIEISSSNGTDFLAEFPKTDRNKLQRT